MLNREWKVAPSAASGTRAAQRRAFARTLLDALRDHHVLAGLTGPDGTVLKVRPPLIWREEHADQFIGALEAALTQIGPS
jgi:4-aminobutyrate aminotransferase-like enzyme